MISHSSYPNGVAFCIIEETIMLVPTTSPSPGAPGAAKLQGHQPRFATLRREHCGRGAIPGRVAADVGLIWLGVSLSTRQFRQVQVCFFSLICLDRSSKSMIGTREIHTLGAAQSLVDQPVNHLVSALHSFS